MVWAYARFSLMLQKDTELLEEKQKLEKLAEGAKKKDLYHLVQDTNHHFY